MARFKIDQQGMRALKASDATAAAAMSAANVIRGSIRAVAPATRARRFIKSLQVVDGELEDGVRTARVTTDDFRWHWLEYGTAHTPTFRPFMHGVTRAGARWKDTGK